jgi:hypothetical protein
VFPVYKNLSSGYARIGMSIDFKFLSRHELLGTEKHIVLIKEIKK